MNENNLKKAVAVCDSKVCVRCKKLLPKTDEYFFARVIKQKLANGEIAVYNCFRSFCKKCHGVSGNKNRIKKRCLEMNCNVSEYDEKWKLQYSETRTHFKEIINLPDGVKNVLRNKMKNGYVFENYEKYRIDCRKNISKAARKYDYGNLDFVPKNTQTGIKYLTNGYVALTLGHRVKDVPKEILETKRLTILLKRELINLKTN